MKSALVGFLIVICSMAIAQNANEINLAGEWRFALDPEGRGESEQWFQRDLADTIPLPGTTDLAGKGYPLRRDTMDYGVPLLESDWPSKPAPARADEAGHLVREFYYVGKAWYQRTIEIPKEWEGRHVRLFLERVLWRSDAWLDDRHAGNADSLATAHWLDLGKLTPGPHRLSIRVDNSLQCNIGIATHAVGPETQSQWNGIVGAIRLVAETPVFIAQSRLFPAADRLSVRAEATLRNTTGAPWKGTLVCRIEDESGRQLAASEAVNVDCPGDTQTVSLTVPLTEPAKPWDEFSPVRYRAILALNEEPGKTESFGFRHIAREGRHILINGRRAYLRGTLDCAVYPKTGHPPVTVEEWLRVLGTVKDYGFNHVRFHTWCPPEAAFEAADRLGIYLQPETALWIDSWTTNTSTKPQPPGRDPAVSDFIQREIRRISDAYGNHPSFALFCIGNEFSTDQSDWQAINQWIVDAKTHDPRRLYAASTARKPCPADDFRVTHDVDSKPTRGMLHPHTNWDFTESAALSPIPVIAHETGQRPVFPDYETLLPKFTGPLEPLNYERFQKSFEQSGLADQKSDFLRASARFQLVQYKAEHEAMLRSPDSAGYQLLMLNDFTGQSEALVGVLDPFWESKGVVSREEIVAWNNPTVPLARFDKYTWSNTEDFHAIVEAAHYGPANLESQTVAWKLIASNGSVVGNGEFPAQTIPTGAVTRLGEITVPLSTLTQATALTLTVRIGQAENTWNLWSYPATTVEPPADLLLTRNLEDALAALDAGKSVLLIAHGLKGTHATPSTFASVYWSAGWWGGPTSNLGILCDPAHPALHAFPNTGHSDWQWYDLAEGATTFHFTDAPAGFRPIVQLVPDFHFNTLLGQLFEARVAEGRLIVSGYNLDTTPAARQLRNSLLTYMQSDSFHPPCTFTPDQLRALFK